MRHHDSWTVRGWSKTSSFLMPVSLCNKAIHTCHLQSASSFHDAHERHLSKDTFLLRDRWQRWLALALQWVYCKELLHPYLNHLRACADSYTNISRGVHSRRAFISPRALDGVAFILGRRSFKGGVQSNKYGIQQFSSKINEVGFSIFLHVNNL